MISEKTNPSGQRALMKATCTGVVLLKAESLFVLNPWLWNFSTFDGQTLEVLVQNSDKK